MRVPVVYPVLVPDKELSTKNSCLNAVTLSLNSDIFFVVYYFRNNHVLNNFFEIKRNFRFYLIIDASASAKVASAKC